MQTDNSESSTMSISIALITPTLGRETLERTLESGLSQLAAEDEWLIVGDGPQPHARQVVAERADERIRYWEHADAASSYGNAHRNCAMGAAQADYFLFVDDDDVLLDGALDAVRREAASGKPLMFRMDYGPKNCLLWRERIVREANVGGAMFVIPNRSGLFAEWAETARPGMSDFQFITRTLDLWPPDSLRWCEDVICRCEAHGKGLGGTVTQGKQAVIHPTANIYQSTIGAETKVAAFVEIGGATVGARCKVQAFAFIPPGVTIGDEVFIGPHVCFTNDRHPRAVGEWSGESTLVEDGASIGAQTTILPGVTIGSGAMIGAGVTVTRDVPPGETVSRSPW